MPYIYCMPGIFSTSNYRSTSERLLTILINYTSVLLMLWPLVRIHTSSYYSKRWLVRRIACKPSEFQTRQKMSLPIICVTPPTIEDDSSGTHKTQVFISNGYHKTKVPLCVYFKWLVSFSSCWLCPVLHSVSTDSGGQTIWACAATSIWGLNDLVKMVVHHFFERPLGHRWLVRKKLCIIITHVWMSTSHYCTE